MERSLLSFLVTLLSLSLVGLAVPTWMPDEYPPDLITVVNSHSSGGQYYLKSSTDQGKYLPLWGRASIDNFAISAGEEGDCRVDRNLYWPTYSKNHESFAPNFFIRGGDLYSMTNETHILQVVALNITDHHTEHYQATRDNPPSAHAVGHEIIYGPTVRYKLQLVEPKKVYKNTGEGEGKYAVGKWSWYGPILLYSFGPHHKDVKGTLFYTCMDGVYLDIHRLVPFFFIDEWCLEIW
jgi:hypothetical protein